MSALRLSAPGQPTRHVDLGPSPARVTAVPYSAVHAANVGAMTPVLSPGGNAHEWIGARKAFSLRGAKYAPEPVAPAVCGAPMWYGETCARMPGHRDSHRSRMVMDADAERRRGRGRVQNGV